jgi:raffinose/stachyose/melibiose transport system substrate-binding protein
MQPVVLWYNKDLLKKVGLSEPPATWNDLLDAVKKFNAAGIAPFAIGGASKWPELMWIEYLTDRIGGPKVKLMVAMSADESRLAQLTG